MIMFCVIVKVLILDYNVTQKPDYKLWFAIFVVPLNQLQQLRGEKEIEFIR